MPDVPRLLLLDDNRDWLETARELLGCRFDTTITTSVRDACDLVEAERFDLVVLDLRLGEDDGLDVLRRMRTPTLRAIILTGYPEERSMWKAAKFGALEYVVKGTADALLTLPETVSKILEAASPRVFLSYARKDVERVLPIYKAMARVGLLPWMDLENIEPDRPWAQDIKSALRECDHFVLFLSSLSLVRRLESGQLQEEEREARARAALMPPAFFLVVRLEECSVPKELADRQCVDLFQEGGLEKLLTFLARARPAEI